MIVKLRNIYPAEIDKLILSIVIVLSVFIYQIFFWIRIMFLRVKITNEKVFFIYPWAEKSFFITSFLECRKLHRGIIFRTEAYEFTSGINKCERITFWGDGVNCKQLKNELETRKKVILKQL